MGSVCTSFVGEEAAQPIESAHEFAGKVAAHGPNRGVGGWAAPCVITHPVA